MIKKPKVLLIDTPYNLASEADPPRVYLSQAAMYLGTVLKRAGYEVVVYDPKISCKKNAHTGKYKGIYYVGDTFAEIQRRIKKEKPDIVAVTNLFSKDANNAIEVCKRVKQVSPKIVTVVGGTHATAVPKEFLGEPAIDIVAIGEGENTMLEVVQWLQGNKKLSQINGIGYKRRDGAMIFNQPRLMIRDLNELGYPDYTLTDLGKYFEINNRGYGPRPLGQGKRLFSTTTSRGCPYRCSFCACRNTAGLRFRPYSTRMFLGHLEEMVDRYDIDSIAFEDDNLSFDKKRFAEIVDGLLHFKKRPLVWGTPNGVRADTLLDKRLLKKIKRSGCQYLTVGVESGNQEVLDTIVDKRLDLNVIRKLVKMCAEVDMSLNGFFIIGFPHEKLSQIHDTLNFALEMNSKYGMYPYVNFAIPMKGTVMYDIAKRDGFLIEDITPKSLVESSSFRGKGKIRTPEFTPEILSDQMLEFNSRIFRNSLWRAIKSPKVAWRYSKLALQNFSHFKRYVLG